jgi:predicted RNA methylase
MTPSANLLTDPIIREWAHRNIEEWDRAPDARFAKWARDSIGGEAARAALTLLSIWAKHRAKFPHWPAISSDPEGAEQASGERAARWRAARFSGYAHTLDLCSGIGADAIALSQTCEHVVAVDRSHDKLVCARTNVTLYGQPEHCDFLCADVEHELPAADAIALDPDRRAHGRRVVRPDLYSPPLANWERIRRRVRTCAVKVAPGIAYQDISRDAVAEFIQDRGECREAVLWFGERAPRARTATILRSDEPLSAFTMDALEPESFDLASVGSVLYDPHPAVIRAHLITQLAAQLGAWRLDEHTAYLSSDVNSQTPFADTFAVAAVLQFHLKRLRQLLRDRQIGSLEIRTRRFPIPPDDLRKMLTLRGDNAATLVLTRCEGAATAILCHASRT